MFIFASVKLYINTIMETTNITKQNPIRRLLEYKRAMRECIQRGADHEEMKKITNDYGFTLATPVWIRTVIDILRRFFDKVENAMIMVCDNTDGKQAKRRVLFNRWFNFYNDGTLSSRSAEVCEGYYQLLVSIYFKNNNPNKQQLIKSFNDLMSRDIYEIVVWLYSIKSLYTLFI